MVKSALLRLQDQPEIGLQPDVAQIKNDTRVKKIFASALQ
jgi:hypothetical protein